MRFVEESNRTQTMMNRIRWSPALAALRILFPSSQSAIQHVKAISFSALADHKNAPSLPRMALSIFRSLSLRPGGFGVAGESIAASGGATDCNSTTRVAIALTNGANDPGSDTSLARIKPSPAPLAFTACNTISQSVQVHDRLARPALRGAQFHSRYLCTQRVRIA